MCGALVPVLDRGIWSNPTFAHGIHELVDRHAGKERGFAHRYLAFSVAFHRQVESVPLQPLLGRSNQLPFQSSMTTMDVTHVPPARSRWHPPGDAEQALNPNPLRLIRNGYRDQSLVDYHPLSQRESITDFKLVQ